jgi:hypothetical protein
MRKKSKIPYEYFSPEYIDKMNTVRSAIGLKPLKVQELNCLKCDRRFISFGSQNRMCDSCRGCESTIFDDDVDV